ncbi:MAG: helix-turn-helix transcriptional regulator [Kiritimatiellae bacterium]|nr:helix-turn-helix transcriptional regulator [Kiritimatiellia bacterium]
MSGNGTKEKIIDSAVGVFAERGFRDATVRDICANAGVNVSVVNYHFGSKEALYAEVVRRLFSFATRANFGRISAAVHDAESWRRSMRSFVETFLRYMSVTEKPDVYTARIFRWEVTRPSSICQELQVTYGKLVYAELEKLLSMALAGDRLKVKLWSASIWSRMAIFALADEQWLKPFAPEGLTRGEWIKATADFICEDIFKSLEYGGSVKKKRKAKAGPLRRAGASGRRRAAGGGK